MNELLTVHEDLSAELAELLLDRAQTQAAIETARANVFEQQYAAGTNITTIREMASTMTARFTSETLILTGRIDATRARLHHIELRLRETDAI